MKIIHVPAPIPLTSAPDAERVTFAVFARRALLNDQKFGADFDAVRKAMKVDQGLETLPADEACELVLDEGAWDVLCAVAKKPSGGHYPGLTPLGVVRLMPFLEAILDAEEYTPPKPAKARAAEPVEAAEA